ncbi:hypothetical protein CPter91_0026 [Collimonas pratensis]|uniref:Uncharacterized protein n=1 Tax=Collimonas pratensis TaxID=279113 RepID=A0A127PXD9_9BURK|nr:hypothetical protein CPter91_0026 [Collimonas pratensis]
MRSKNRQKTDRNTQKKPMTDKHVAMPEPWPPYPASISGQHQT